MVQSERLISAGKLETVLAKRFRSKGMIHYDDLMAAIADIPTVDAVEVVHGRWVAVPSSDMMTGKAYKCSECNKMRYGSFMPNYCQNCGAKMDGERRKGE